MFALSEQDLRRPIVGVADGPASFNAELSAAGGRVVSVDPLYVYSAERIQARFEAVFAEVLAAARATADAFVWDEIPSIDELGRRRRRAAAVFLADYETGSAPGTLRRRRPAAASAGRWSVRSRPPFALPVHLQ